MQFYSDSTVILQQKTNFCFSTVGLSLLGSAKKTFSLTLNVMISQLDRLFELKFGVHVQQQVRFKILRLHTFEKLPYLGNLPCTREVRF